MSKCAFITSDGFSPSDRPRLEKVIENFNKEIRREMLDLPIKDIRIGASHPGGFSDTIVMSISITYTE